MMNSATSLRDVIFGDLEREVSFTRKVLERLPAEHFEWRPHERSMTLGRLGLHVSGMPDWVRATLGADGLGAGKAPRPPGKLRVNAGVLGRVERKVGAMSSGRFESLRGILRRR